MDRIWSNDSTRLRVSPTLLPSAFYREFHSSKIPQINCAMVHTVLLYVVHAKLLSISTWKKAAALIARVTRSYSAIKSQRTGDGSFGDCENVFSYCRIQYLLYSTFYCVALVSVKASH